MNLKYPRMCEVSILVDIKKLKRLFVLLRFAVVTVTRKRSLSAYATAHFQQSSLMSLLTKSNKLDNNNFKLILCQPFCSLEQKKNCLISCSIGFHSLLLPANMLHFFPVVANFRFLLHITHMPSFEIKLG